MGLEVERQQLEHECNTSQDDALTEESRYHFLQSLCSITDARLQSVRQDERYLIFFAVFPPMQKTTTYLLLYRKLKSIRTDLRVWLKVASVSRKGIPGTGACKQGGDNTEKHDDETTHARFFPTVERMHGL